MLNFDWLPVIVWLSDYNCELWFCSCLSVLWVSSQSHCVLCDSHVHTVQFWYQLLSLWYCGPFDTLNFDTVYFVILYTLLNCILCDIVYSVKLYTLWYYILCDTVHFVILYTVWYWSFTLCDTVYSVLLHTLCTVILYTLYSGIVYTLYTMIL